MKTIALAVAISAITTVSAVAAGSYTYRCQMHIVVANAKEYVVVVTNGNVGGTETR